MSTEEPIRDSPAPSQDAAMQVETTPAPDAGADGTTTKKRPRIDMAVEPRERKRGKTMFGLVLGTLKRAQNEDKERNASDAAKKRQLIEQRLQDKLRKETDSVRRAEEAKKDKTIANRKEEELQLKDSVHKLRRTRFPLLSNFLLTSDVIPSGDSEEPASTNPLAPPPRTRPPPLYYLPTKLLPSQDAFLQRRKAEVKEAAEAEWEAFKAERAAGVEEISQLRQRVAEEEGRKKTERSEGDDKPSEPTAPDAPMAVEGEEKPAAPPASAPSHPAEENGETTMDVDDAKPAESQPADAKAGGESKEDAGPKKTEAPSAPAAGDDDDAVEY